jgi:hypothetical protein
MIPLSKDIAPTFPLKHNLSTKDMLDINGKAVYSDQSSKKELLMRFLLLALLVGVAHAVTSSQMSDYFLWSSSNGNNVIVLRDGTVATVAVQWVGLSAWYDMSGITSWYKTVVAAGQVPYFHDYSLGTIVYGNKAITYSSILSFDTNLAKLIGNTIAFVNLDTEWGKINLLMCQLTKIDANGVYPYAISSDGINNFLARIKIFRQYAPNAKLSASGGFWTLDYGSSSINYAAFKSVDALLDLRSTLYSAVTSDSSCCWRQLSGSSGPTTMYTDGVSLATAQQSTSILNRRNGYMNKLWGTTSRKWFAADVAVTSCGWGVSGQAAIIQNIVSNLPTLFSAGFRGMVLRNISPPTQYRFMGQNNEAGFTWYPPSSGVYTTSTTVAAGLTAAVNLMKGLSYSTTSISVTAVSAKWTSNFIAVVVSPVTNVAKVTASYVDSSSVSRSITLALVSGTTTQFSGTTPNTMPSGAAVSIVVTLKSGVTQKNVLTNGVSRSVAKVLPGFNSYWIQVSVTPLTSVTKVTAQYLDWSKVSHTVTLTKNAYSQYQAAPPTQIPYGNAVTITATDSTGTQKGIVYSGTVLTVKTISGWNSWWIQISVSPVTLVTKVKATFTDYSKVKHVIGLTYISGTTQYQGSPGAQIPTGGQVQIDVTLSDGTVQTYYLTNTASRSGEEEATPGALYSKWISLVFYIGGFFVISTALAVGVILILQCRTRQHRLEPKDLIFSPGTPDSDIELRSPESPKSLLLKDGLPRDK